MSQHWVLGVKKNDMADANAVSQSLGLGDLFDDSLHIGKGKPGQIRITGIALRSIELRRLKDAIRAAGIRMSGEKTDRNVSGDARRRAEELVTANKIDGRDDFTTPGGKIPPGR